MWTKPSIRGAFPSHSRQRFSLPPSGLPSRPGPSPDGVAPDVPGERREDRRVSTPSQRLAQLYAAAHSTPPCKSTPTGASTGIYGVVNFRRLTPRPTSTPASSPCSSCTSPTTNFPNVPQAEATKLDGIVREIPLTNSTVPLATVLASLDAEGASTVSAPVSVTPPTIYYTQKNAMLVVFDRDPIWPDSKERA